MYPVPSALRVKTAPSVALVILFTIGLAAQAQSVSYTTYSGPALVSINWVTAGPDGALWFTGSSPSKAEIGRITTAGAVMDYPTSNTPGVIVAGPDGALWFTEYNVNQIGRITTDGLITEYPLPAQAVWITSGPDGALWFTERSAVNIGRITTTGVVTEYPVPSLNASGAIVITTGPDGALWFTDSGGNKIGRITTTGASAEYNLSPSDGFLDALAVGPDGALWYATFGPGVIGRMTTGGVITAEYLFDTPGNAFVPYDLTVGPDGALWFIWASVDGGDIALARISTAGVLTQYSLPASLPAGGSSITRGPDNALWIAGGGASTPFGTTRSTFVRVGIGTGPSITVSTSPNGLAISVDGVSYFAPQSFPCTPGTPHTLAVGSPQPIGLTGTQYAFAGWTDGVSSSARQVTCTSTPSTFTANFDEQYRLTTTVSPAGAGTIMANPSSPNGFYNSGTSVQLTASSNFLSWTGNLSGSANPQSIVMDGPKSVTANFGTATTGTAAFLKTDITASGTWTAAYGVDGYNVIGDLTSYPAYVTVTPSGNAMWTWASSTTDTRALQKPSLPVDRVAACWYAWGSFSFDVHFNDANPHQVALYALDFDTFGGGRTERIDILDANGNLLDTRSVSSFVGGTYLVWNLSGHVVVRVTNTNPAGNAVVSGIFFGGPGAAPPPTGTAAFLRTDTSTSGTWTGVYGAEGYNVIGDLANYPAYATVTPLGNAMWTWAASTSDPRALQKPSLPADRIAACWYAWGSFSVDLRFNDTNPHQVALYALDFDIFGAGRTERIDILDANGYILDTRSVSSFVGGTYLVWNLSGHVIVRVTNTNPAGNAVVSGLFFR